MVNSILAVFQCVPINLYNPLEARRPLVTTSAASMVANAANWTAVPGAVELLPVGLERSDGMFWLLDPDMRCFEGQHL